MEMFFKELENKKEEMRNKTQESKPLTEGSTKSNVKNTKDKKRRCPPPPPPKPPLNRVLREGVGDFCLKCGSTVSKDGVFGLFGEMLCHNQECINSKSKTTWKS